MPNRHEDASADEPPPFAPGERGVSDPVMPTRPLQPPTDTARPRSGSFFPAAMMLFGIGLLCSMLLVCGGGNPGVLLLVAGLGGFFAIHYLVWGWWIGRVIDRRGKEDQVILVDENDREIGVEGKTRAHQQGGMLHRALSIFIFNTQGQMLLQLRSTRKYHFGGLWTNACCSHPRPGETLIQAAHRCLQHELGFDTELHEACSFVYRAKDPAGDLCEHEFDHVLVGQFDGDPVPNPNEVDAWQWVDVDELRDDLARSPDQYTPWFPIAFEKLEATGAS